MDMYYYVLLIVVCGQSQMLKLWHGARILSGLVAKVKMAKMTKIYNLGPDQK